MWRCCGGGAQCRLLLWVALGHSAAGCAQGHRVTMETASHAGAFWVYFMAGAGCGASFVSSGDLMVLWGDWTFSTETGHTHNHTQQNDNIMADEGWTLVRGSAYRAKTRASKRAVKAAVKAAEETPLGGMGLAPPAGTKAALKNKRRRDRHRAEAAAKKNVTGTKEGEAVEDSEEARMAVLAVVSHEAGGFKRPPPGLVHPAIDSAIQSMN